MKIDSMLEFQHKLSQRYNTLFGIIILDIDHFKDVNDTYGHQVGDDVLKQFSKILKGSIRDTDSLGRWGGEEFLIICPNTDAAALKKMAENLREKIETHDFSNDIQRLTASFGITCYNGEQDVVTLLKEADAALYSAKKLGRNKIVIASV